jgi:acetyl-CoA carboxylase biotin carboxyl carrier protein
MNSVPFDPAAVRALADILADTGLTEIEIEGKDGRIRVVRAPSPVMAASHTVPVQVAAPVAAAPAPVAAAAPPPAADDDARHPGAVLSPMVGIAYLSPEPGSTAFVVPGQAVAAGQTLLLIEAMKTFNQIKAPKAGTVARILITTGAPVEYGEPLMILE